MSLEKLLESLSDEGKCRLLKTIMYSNDSQFSTKLKLDASIMYNELCYSNVVQRVEKEDREEREVYKNYISKNNL